MRNKPAKSYAIKPAPNKRHICFAAITFDGWVCNNKSSMGTAAFYQEVEIKKHKLTLLSDPCSKKERGCLEFRPGTYTDTQRRMRDDPKEKYDPNGTYCSPETDRPAGVPPCRIDLDCAEDGSIREWDFPGAELFVTANNKPFVLESVEWDMRFVTYLIWICGDKDPVRYELRRIPWSTCGLIKLDEASIKCVNGEPDASLLKYEYVCVHNKKSGAIDGQCVVLAPLAARDARGNVNPVIPAGPCVAPTACPCPKEENK